MASFWRQLGKALLSAVLDGQRKIGSSRTPSLGGRGATGGATLLDAPGRSGNGATKDASAEDVRRARITYDPNPDGDPDPGEVIWTWVPYVEQDGRGKDRPVLIIGRIDSSTVIGCYLSTKQHRGFLSVGTGAWDPQGRESFLAPDRLLRITDAGMRREGHVLPRQRFDSVTKVVAQQHGIAG